MERFNKVVLFSLPQPFEYSSQQHDSANRQPFEGRHHHTRHLHLLLCHFLEQLLDVRSCFTTDMTKLGL